MRTEGQVRHKLQQATYRHLQREIRTKLSRRPENCAHNRRVKLPVVSVRFCTLREDDSGAFQTCDEACGGLDQAAKCPDFECAHTKESVREDFAKFLSTSDVATIAAEYPDLAALLWTLDATDRPVPVEVAPEPETSPAPETPIAPAPPLPPYQILYLHPEGGASVYYTVPAHRAYVYDAMFPTKGEP